MNFVSKNLPLLILPISAFKFLYFLSKNSYKFSYFSLNLKLKYGSPFSLFKEAYWGIKSSLMYLINCCVSNEERLSFFFISIISAGELLSVIFFPKYLEAPGINL